MPESIPHQEAAEHLKELLDAWAARSERNVKVARNLAIRFIQQMPSVGIDPDVCVLEPPPENAEDLSSLCTWKAGHVPPPVCFEIVSANHPHKDYVSIQERYAALGTSELIVFDPLLVGPAALGGPVALQLWRRDALGVFERVALTNAPVYSEVLEAWVIPEGRHLVLADDARGRSRWLTAAGTASVRAEAERRERLLAEDRAERERAEKERERAEKERERAEKERERAAREDLERRLAALEAKSRSGG